ncbi:MAG: LON peptidase substrate-binding domain-containing protein [Alphaproteobacteria bacterium]|nr:LON peptidase substrate-binding domain-containing protein [Alphaproteobacteria bacterium]
MLNDPTNPKNLGPKIAGTPFITRPEDLPEIIPIFPLAGVLLLPGGRLPLNIFEPRYLAMIENALAHKRIFGMVQPTGINNPDGSSQVFKVGCAGRIHSFNETDDGRLLISLVGVCRFRIREEVELQHGFRRAKAEWDDYLHDLTETCKPACVDRDKLMQHMKCYFKLQGVAGDWDVIEKTNDNKLITSLAMICPFQPSEKQALLEAKTIEERCRLLTTLMDMALLGEENDDCDTIKH